MLRLFWLMWQLRCHPVAKYAHPSGPWADRPVCASADGCTKDANFGWRTLTLIVGAITLFLFGIRFFALCVGLASMH